jgi:hypothetical protein
MRNTCFAKVVTKSLSKKGERNWSIKIFWFGSISSYRFVGGKEGRRSPPMRMISDEEELTSDKSCW